VESAFLLYPLLQGDPAELAASAAPQAMARRDCELVSVTVPVNPLREKG